MSDQQIIQTVIAWASALGAVACAISARRHATRARNALRQVELAAMTKRRLREGQRRD